MRERFLFLDGVAMTAWSVNAVRVIACVLFVILVNCDRADKTPRVERKSPATQTLVIGLIPERNIFEQVERYRPLANYLTDKLEARIHLNALTRYGNIIENFVSMGLDGAFFGSFTYTLAHKKLGVEVLARPEGLDGSSTYHGLLFVRNDSGISSANDMEGKTFAFVDKATTAGYLLPLAYFKRHGIGDYKSYLKETYFTGTHNDAIYDVLNGKADIGAAKNTVFYELAAVDSRIKNELTVLERSPDVPENGLAVRHDLSPSLKKRLREVLVHMHEDPAGKRILKEFGASRFVETRDGHYGGVYEYVREIGLDLAKYDYINE